MPRRFLLAFSVLAVTATRALSACDPHEPARASLVNELPAQGTESYTIEKAWYRTTLFFRPVRPGEVSETSSVGFGREHAYFVLAIGEPPRRIVAATSREVETSVGEQATIVVNLQTIRSECVGAKLSEADWKFIRERIFPGDEIDGFGTACPQPAPSDGGAEGGDDAPQSVPDGGGVQDAARG